MSLVRREICCLSYLIDSCDTNFLCPIRKNLPADQTSRDWHTLRHTFATLAVRGYIDATMRYVHYFRWQAPNEFNDNIRPSNLNSRGFRKPKQPQKTYRIPQEI